MCCQNCGTLYQDNQKYCEKCGQEIKETPTNLEDSVLHGAKEPSEEEFLMTFVDKNQSFYSRKWKKMTEKGSEFSVNIAAFFFSIFWLGYRKMYKPVFFIALFYLLIDIVLYLVGYKYDPSNIVDPIDNSIGLGVAVTIGFFGNQFYKNHAERKIKLLKETGNISEQSLKKKGGRNLLGSLLALLILVGVYLIPTLFIPLNMDAVDKVKYADFYEYPDVNIEVLFDDLFIDGKWSHNESTDEYDIVEYAGEKKVDSVVHHVSIVFITEQGEEEVEVQYIVTDSKELDDYGTYDFLEYLFNEHDKLN